MSDLKNFLYLTTPEGVLFLLDWMFIMHAGYGYCPNTFPVVRHIIRVSFVYI